MFGVVRGWVGWLRWEQVGWCAQIVELFLFFRTCDVVIGLVDENVLTRGEPELKYVLVPQLYIPRGFDLRTYDKH